MLENKLKHNGFFELIADAIFQHNQAKSASESYVVNRFARASIMSSAFSVECFANSLISIAGFSEKLRSSVDKLDPISKVELCLREKQNLSFDRGRQDVKRISNLIRLRNEFVHPKSSNVPAEIKNIQEMQHNYKINVAFQPGVWDFLEVPRNSIFWSSDSSEKILRAISDFYKHIICDQLLLDKNEMLTTFSSIFDIGGTWILAVAEEVKKEIKEFSCVVDFEYFRVLEDLEQQDRPTDLCK